MRLLSWEIWASFEVNRTFLLPFHSGSMVHGLLGASLRKLGCTAPPDSCSELCQRHALCTYARLFAPLVPDPSPHPAFNPNSSPPPRLIPLIAPPLQRICLEGQTVRLGFRVLGALPPRDRAILLAAIEGMAGMPWGDQEEGKVQYVGEHRGELLESRLDLPSVDDLDESEGRVDIHFETPAWLMQHNRLMMEPDFPTLLAVAFRHLSQVSALYGEPFSEGHDIPERLIELSAKVRVLRKRLHYLDWDHHSRTQDKHHKMMGIVGHLVCEGPIGPFLPVLQAAEITHVGKSTAFGLGRVRVMNSVHTSVSRDEQGLEAEIINSG